MKYIRLSFEYFTFKKWIVYTLLCVIPAFSFIILNSGNSLINVLIHYDTFNFSTLGSILHIIFGRMNWWVSLIALAVDSIIIAFIFGTLDRDMRLGDFALQHVRRRINMNIFVCLAGIALMILVFFFNKVIIAAFLLLWARVTQDILLRSVLFVVTSGLFFAVMMIFFTFLILTPALVVSGGRRINVAISESLKAVKDHFYSLLFAIIVFPFAKFVIIQLVSLLNIAWITLITEILINTFLVVYFCSLMFTSTFDIFAFERVDKQTGIRW